MWHWAAFISGISVLLALDLRVLHRRPRAESFRAAVGWTALWFSLAMMSACIVGVRWGKEDALQFVTGYLVELSLSMDNVFVMALIFAYFAVPVGSQHRVLFFGIWGAMLLRGLMILVGVELVQHLAWMLEAFGVFLLISGVKMTFLNHQEVHAEKNPVIKLARRILPLSSDYVGHQGFFGRGRGSLRAGDNRLRCSERFRATSQEAGLHSEAFLSATIALKAQITSLGRASSAIEFCATRAAR